MKVEARELLELRQLQQQPLCRLGWIFTVSYEVQLPQPCQLADNLQPLLAGISCQAQCVQPTQPLQKEKK